MLELFTAFRKSGKSVTLPCVALKRLVYLLKIKQEVLVMMFTDII